VSKALDFREVSAIVRDLRVEVVGNKLDVVPVPLGLGLVGIQVGCLLPCVNSQEEVWQWGRTWLIEHGATQDSVIKTVYLAVKQFVEHEAAEGIMFRGVRVFDPHKELLK